MKIAKEKQLWKLYRVRWDFLTSLCASVPANPQLISAWLAARAPEAVPPGGRTISEIQEEIVATLVGAEEDLRQKNLLVFQRVEGALVVRAATVRAHLKDCARIVSREYVGKIKGEMSFASRLINCCYLDESVYWLPILRSDGAPFTAPDGVREKAVHLWSGNALKAFEYVHDAHIEFTLKVLGGNFSMDDLSTVFLYGGVHGYAGERGDGEGRYAHTIEEVEPRSALG